MYFSINLKNCILTIDYFSCIILTEKKRVCYRTALANAGYSFFFFFVKSAKNKKREAIFNQLLVSLLPYYHIQMFFSVQF